MKKLITIISTSLISLTAYPMGDFGYGSNSTVINQYQFPVGNTVSSSFSYESARIPCTPVCIPGQAPSLSGQTFDVGPCIHYDPDTIACAFRNTSDNTLGKVFLRSSKNGCDATIVQPCESGQCEKETAVQNEYQNSDFRKLTCFEVCSKNIKTFEKIALDPETTLIIGCDRENCVARVSTKSEKTCEALQKTLEAEILEEEPQQELQTSAASTPSPGMGIFISALMLGQLLAPPLAFMAGLG